jgi:hypothetical protein
LSKSSANQQNRLSLHRKCKSNGLFSAFRGHSCIFKVDFTKKSVENVQDIAKNPIFAPITGKNTEESMPKTEQL